MIYKNCFLLVETIDFYIKSIPIRVNMQKLELSKCSPVRRRNMARSPRRHVWWVARANRCFAWAIWLSRWPMIKKVQHESYSSRRNIQGCFWTHFHLVYHHKNDPQGAASLNRTALESSDKTNPNLTRVLDVNPSLFLAREVQPPLIYLKGDGRLNNNTQSNNQSIFYPSFTSLPCSFSLVLRSFFFIAGRRTSRL